MRTTGIVIAKQTIAAAADAMAANENARIARRGCVAVRSLPVGRPPLLTPAQVEEELAQLRRLLSRVRPGPGWRELRDEGRE